MTAPAIGITRVPAAGPGRLFGVLLSVDLRDCDPRVITNPDEIVTILGVLVEKIGMKTYGAPYVQQGREHFGDGEIAGWTVIQLIETSSITVHACDGDGSAFVDVFTCGALDPDLVVPLLTEMFGAAAAAATFSERRVP